MGAPQLLAIAVFALAGSVYSAENKVICYYNSQSLNRQGQGKFEVSFLEPALQFCTHLIYGYAGINEANYKLSPLDEKIDVTKDHYRTITNLKRKYPGLRVLLSVGGGEDVQGEKEKKNIKYRTLLESVDHRLEFVKSATAFMKDYGFDGLDLCWEFPENKPKKVHGAIKSWLISIKKAVVGDSVIDEKAEDHREQFTALVRELRNQFRHDGLLLSLCVLPNVNSSVYYDAKALSPQLDWVSLRAYDFYTPERNPKVADYPSPLYDLPERKIEENIDFQVRHWLNASFPAEKLILGIPTFGRAWKTTTESGLTGVPPLPADGPALPGPYTNEAGILSYFEVCAKLSNPQQLQANSGTHLRKVGDPTKRYAESEVWQYSDVTKRFGVYAFRIPDKKEDTGTWVAYEDPDTAGNKAAYARAKGLGGIAIDDLSFDDFRALCNGGEKFPILRAAKSRL